jgi:hypothetical protein
MASSRPSIGVNSIGINSLSSPTTAENDIEEYSHSVRDREFFLSDIPVSHSWALYDWILPPLLQPRLSRCHPACLDRPRPPARKPEKAAFFTSFLVRAAAKKMLVVA